MKRLLNFARDDNGAVSLEYAMIGAFLSILILSAITSIGTTLSTMFLGPVGSALK